ncbi:MAG TPA: hypothetical protein VL549_16360 [Gemmatimonadales bacterium]|jgi:hypothetical protein|nr:hypothetical protein [Gemmatimonadales bacterium]
MKSLALVSLLLMPIACAGQARTTRNGNDPCTLVSRAEAERILGPMRHDPYRVAGTNREPAATGSYCYYEARNGRRVIMDVDWTDGRQEMKIVGMMGSLVEQVISTDSGQADTLDAHWDELRMLPGNNLYARKGDQLVQLDYNGSRIGIVGAAKFVNIALDRMASGHLLAYDGAAAGRTAPGPIVTPGDPCGLIAQADFERIVGPLAHKPEAGPHGDQCTYTLAQSRGLLAGDKVELQIFWKDGFAAIDNSGSSVRNVTAHVAPQVAQGTNTSAPTAHASAPKNDETVGGFMNKIMNVARSQGIGVQADENGSLKSDTAVSGPWDVGFLNMGLGFSVVKHDAMLSLDLRGITYEQAKALLTKAVERIP